MLTFLFSPAIQAGINSGAYEIVRNQATGELIGVVRDKLTGRFVAHAIATLNNGMSLNPLFFAPQLVMDAAQMYQTHRGFTATLNSLSAIQTSLGILQATTAVIGVGVAAGVVVSGVNLWQTLKLREDVKQLKIDVKEGFIDLKKALKDQGIEIIQRIDEVAQDIQFQQHRLELIKAYGRFIEATKLMKTAMSIQDMGARKVELANARQTLGEALAIYRNPHLLSETSAAGKLRRLECSWAIEQTIALSYQLQGELVAVSDRVDDLQRQIRQDSLNVIESYQSEEELDFIFPEITRIHDHDLALLDSWKNHVDWTRSLPPEELKLLVSSDFSSSEVAFNPDSDVVSSYLATPPEQLLYEDLKQKSHSNSLRDQLRFMMQPELRREAESYINQQATIAEYKIFVPSNLQKTSTSTIANLYWYFKVRDEEARSQNSESISRGFRLATN